MGSVQTQIEQNPSFRIVVRFVLEFLLKVVCAASRAHEGNPARGLIFSAISHANVEHLSKSRELAQRYNWNYPPDEERRPISVNALAQSLNFSTETTRRYVQSLIKRGECVRVGAAGVIVPLKCISSPRFQTLERECFEAFEQLIRDFYGIGFDLDGFLTASANNGVAEDKGETSNLLVQREINAYTLRVILDCIPVHGDFMRTILFTVIMCSNSRHIAYDPSLAWRYAGAYEVPPDSIRLPVSVGQVAQELGMPYTTIHRHIGTMVEDGRCVLENGGVVLLNTTMQRPEVLASGQRLNQWFFAMLKQLSMLGFDFSQYRDIARSSEAAAV